MFKSITSLFILLLLGFASISHAADQPILASKDASHFDYSTHILIASGVCTHNAQANKSIESRNLFLKKFFPIACALVSHFISLSPSELRFDPIDSFFSQSHQQLEILSSRSHPPTFS